MIKKWMARGAAVLLCLGLLLSPAGCQQDKTADAVITFGMEERPQTLDPQLASGETELLIVRNLFEGLLRQDREGNIVEGAAESYTLSADGRTYTFTLREARWQDDTPVTAADFVFGLQRAVDPANKAPLGSLLTPIQGAAQILSGDAAADTLGVSAPDERTVVITLTEPDPDFPRVLTLSVAMPCNEAFFLKTAGMYGRSLDATPANGSFTLRRWEEDASIRLSRNKDYTGPFPAKPSAVVLATGREKQTNDPEEDLDDTTYRLNRLLDGTLDGGRLSASYGEQAEAAGFTVTAFQDTLWAVAVNPNTPFGGADMQKALRESINRNAVASALPAYFSRADGYMPAAVTLRGTSFRERVRADYSFAYDPSGARDALAETAEAQRGGRMPAAVLYYVDEPGMKEAASLIAQQWQQNLGLYCNVEAKSRSALLSAVSSGSYQLALVPFSSEDGTVQSFLRQFTSGSSRAAGFADEGFDQRVAGMTGGRSDEELYAAAEAAEDALLAYNGITPVFWSSSDYALSPSITDLRLDAAGGRADFSFAGKVQS